MKKGIIFHSSLLSLLLMCILNVYGQHFISDPHEFNLDSWSFSERCNPCHVYSADSRDYRKNYLVSYSTDTLSVSDSTEISGISKICISCHDGTVASIQHQNEFSLLTTMNSNMVFGHPVSIKYPGGDFKTIRYHDPEKTLSGLGGTIDSDLLYEGKVECISCHDFHFSREFTACSTCPPVNLEISLGKGSLLKSNNKSSLCLTCRKL